MQDRGCYAVLHGAVLDLLAEETNSSGEPTAPRDPAFLITLTSLGPSVLHLPPC